MKIVNECGQKWYRWSSWKVTTKKGLFRKLAHYGYAIGPIMFFFSEERQNRRLDRHFGLAHESHLMAPMYPKDPFDKDRECIACNSCTCHSKMYLMKPCTSE